MTIESYVTTADVIVDNPTDPELPDPEVPEPGKLTFIDNWVKGQISLVHYKDVESCELKVDNSVVATINNTGTVNLFVAFTTGKHNLKCGKITYDFTVTDYNP